MPKYCCFEAIILLCLEKRFRKYFKNCASGFIRVFKHSKTIKALSLRSRASISFFVLGNPNETLTLAFEIVHQTHTAVVDCKIYRNEREKENEWNYSTCVIFFFFSKPWSLLNQSFPKLSWYTKPLLILDDVANRHLLLRSKMKKKKRNIIKHVRGFFHSYFKKAGRPWVVKGKQCEVRVRYVRFISSYKGSSNVFFCLKADKNSKKTPCFILP